MAVTYTNAVKVARMNAVVTAIGASGLVKLFTAADALLATFTLAATAGTVAGAGVLTLSDANGATPGIMNTTASAAGTAAKCSIQTSGGTDIITGLTVGTSGTDVIIDNPVLASGQAVQINTGTITHAA